MKTYDNEGKLRSEINTAYTQDGKVVTTNTLSFLKSPQEKWVVVWL